MFAFVLGNDALRRRKNQIQNDLEPLWLAGHFFLRRWWGGPAGHTGPERKNFLFLGEKICDWTLGGRLVDERAKKCDMIIV